MRDVFIALIRNAIRKTNEEIKLSDVNFESLYSLSKFHDISHLVYYELKRRDAIGEEDVFSQFKRQFDLAVFRNFRREATITRVRDLLESAGIPFIMLKGVYIKDLYPEPWMRTSSDIDVLIMEDDLERAKELFASSGMEWQNDRRYDVLFLTPDLFHVELHFDLAKDYVTDKNEEMMKRVWDFASPKQGCRSEMVLSDEMFYYYHIAHMAKHFLNGGSGVRSIIDTWLLNNSSSHDGEKRKSLLSEGKLLVFEEKAKELSEKWMSGTDNVDPVISEFEEYIIHGGVYGTSQQMIAVRNNKTGRVKHFFERVFLPYNTIKIRYPILNKIPVLLPFCWVVRWFSLLKPDVRKETRELIRMEFSVDGSSNERVEKLMKQLEIY